MIYRVKDWDKHFEKWESRRCKNMTWVPIPTKNDGAGFRRIAHHHLAAELFSAWILIVEVAAKMPTRGLLFKDGKALTAKDLHYRTGFSEEIFTLAFTVLVDPEIGWLERVAGDEIIEDEQYVEDAKLAEF
ncbi:MAG TPA: hypothetical protein VMW16_17155 [Sedimentisphaerales bacterium]|nr:hypothetical protein [Sedimentisphaerales bacterium]